MRLGGIYVNPNSEVKRVWDGQTGCGARRSRLMMQGLQAGARTIRDWPTFLRREGRTDGGMGLFGPRTLRQMISFTSTFAGRAG